MRDHVMPTDITPTVFVMTNVMKPPTAAQRSEGVACVTAADFRWEKAHIKSTSLLGAVFARQISFDAGAIETVMFRGDYLSEAAASNVWIVKDGVVMGPPKDNLVLEGIRFSLIEEICRTQGIPFQLRRITRAEVLAADEVLAVLRHQRSAGGDPAGRPTGWKRPPRPHLHAIAGWLSAGQGAARHSCLMAAFDFVQGTAPMTAPTDIPPSESLIEYPSQFPIKVMGLKVDGYVQAVTHIAAQFDPNFDASTIELRESKGGKYMGVTVTVTATSREQLDELYRTLSTHPMVKVVL